MNKKELLFLLCLVLIAGGIYFSGILSPKGKGNTALVYADEKEVAALSLEEEDTFVWEAEGHRNEIIVENGKVRMASSSCPDKVCVNQGEISEAGEMIVCLPNKVYIEITGDTPSGASDIVAK